VKTPRKETTKNSQVSTVRIPTFLMPPPARKLQSIASTASWSFQESQFSLRSLAAERKYRERAVENDEERNARLVEDRLRKETTRTNENDEQRNARLVEDRLRQATTRENENDEQRNARLVEDRLRQETTQANENQERRSSRLADMQRRSQLARENESAQQTDERIRSVSVRRRERTMEKNQKAQLDRPHWPAAIPTVLKERCLQDFVHKMSMSNLRQSTCAICNITESANSMSEHNMKDIPNKIRLLCDQDLVGIVPGTQDATESKTRLRDH
jgi:hypothetical protein